MYLGRQVVLTPWRTDCDGLAASRARARARARWQIASTGRCSAQNGATYCWSSYYLMPGASAPASVAKTTECPASVRSFHGTATSVTSKSVSGSGIQIVDMSQTPEVNWMSSRDDGCFFEMHPRFSGCVPQRTSVTQEGKAGL